MTLINGTTVFVFSTLAISVVSRVILVNVFPMINCKVTSQCHVVQLIWRVGEYIRSDINDHKPDFQHSSASVKLGSKNHGLCEEPNVSVTSVVT